MRSARRTLLGIVVTGSLLCAGLAVSAPAGATTAHRHHALSWKLLPTGSKEHFRGLAAVSRKVAWVGGYDGTVLRTTDGGRHWKNVSPAGASALQFRDMAASDAEHAVAMAAGSGTESQLYETDNGGASWHLAYQNTNSAAFFDCMDFSNRRDGLVLSDPVGGKFRILRTENGGRSWRVLSNAGMPPALTGEAGFAAGGDCIATVGRDAWFGGGGGPVSRIFHSRNFGKTWTVRDTPIPSSDSSGVNGVAFRNRYLGVAVGGDFSAPDTNKDVAATSLFGSRWTASRRQPGGYRSGVAFVPHTYATVLTVGLNGSDVSYDAGRIWRPIGSGPFDAVDCAHDGACWASGDVGRVAVLRH